ncbi:solute carrier 6 (neurotransmitter transporter, L-proline), member 7 [Cichlidogyrus casuarinus]|uniref:Solute carrier 6 (Neurotransmitter transporter, L-proline), member 7 n=1 Tax=Cichlidogyrus casuarinus TaxID=1844966 RepID=A0ABD2PPX6_9PLAT
MAAESKVKKDLAFISTNKEKWSNPCEYILTSIGYSVGMGNLLRFPYLCATNGGGSFLVPYFTFIFISAIPLFLAETVTGQYTGLSPVRAFEFAPIFQGIGWGMLSISAIICCYYSTIMTWAVFYFFSSFQWQLPWSSCSNEWNTDKCRVLIPINKSLIITGWVWNPNSSATVVPVYRNTLIYAPFNESYSAGEEFWYHRALKLTPLPMQMGNMNWNLLGCSLLIWIITALCIIWGVKSIGKVVWVTALAPYAMLIVILIRGLTMPGYAIGLKAYLSPEWHRLLDVKLWGLAAVQTFYSIGPGWGGLITMASYNNLHHNCYRDSILLPCISSGTSFFGGFVIFAILGNLAHLVGSENFQAVSKAGYGLAFIAYPEALSFLPGSCIWSVIFFVMLFTLGLDSQFSTLETVTSGLIERFPQTIGRYRKIFIAGICVIGFCISSVFLFEGGFYVFTIMDNYSTAFTAVIIALMESIAYAYFYDARLMIKQMRQMVGDFLWWLKPLWYFLWYAAVPGSLIFVTVVIFRGYHAPAAPFGGQFPNWAIGIGWFFAGISICPVFIVTFHNCFKMRNQLSSLFKPTLFFQTILKTKLQELSIENEVQVDSTRL